MGKEQTTVEPGSTIAPATYYIKIVKGGPYLIYGNPPINEEIIVLNKDGYAWEYKQGHSFKCDGDHCALCRCGESKQKPFCDGSHKNAEWDGTETASRRPLLKGAKMTEGPALILADNEAYCAFARFCDAYGQVWNLVQQAKTEKEQELVRHEVGHCPSGRLVLIEKTSGKVYEPEFNPSIGLIEDPAIQASGPIWVKGGIRVESADGSSYEVRNRVTLCRCGHSANKPFCDGAHASIKFQDGLPLNE